MPARPSIPAHRTPPHPASIPLMFRSMRARLMLWNVLTLAVLMGVLGVFVRYTVRAQMMGSVDRELLMRMRRMMPPPPGEGPPMRGPGFGMGPMRGFGRPPFMGPPDGPPGEPPPDGGGEGGPPVPLRPRILDLKGKDIVGIDSLGPYDTEGFHQATRGQVVFTTVSWDGVPLRVLSGPQPPAGPPERIIQVAYPLTDVNRAVSGLNRTLWTLVPLVLLCAGLGGSLLTDRALRPVRAITRTASRIGARDLSERLPITGQDEFAQLSETFNGMLGRLEASFREQERLVAELRNMVEQQRRFTADASHELRTPLTVIKANTSLALSGGAGPEESRQSFEDIDHAADNAARLVQDLLVLARSDAGQLERDPVRVPLREVLSQAVSRFRRSEGPPVRLAETDSELCVTGNEDELIRLFGNLIENAVRYTPPDGQVTVSAEGGASGVRVQVSDSGIGIAPEHLPHLGERFYRVDPARSRRAGGAGLGLSICRGIVEAHGGTIAFESAPGAGTTVTVHLPACADLRAA